MKLALVVGGGVDRSGRERVVPVLLWLIERLASRHTVHVIVLDYYPEPCTYELCGAVVHDVGRVAAPRGFRRRGIAKRLAETLRRHGPFDVVHAYLGMPAGAATVPVAQQLRIPAVVTLASGELVGLGDIRYGLQRRLIDRIAVARIFRGASAVTVPTSYMARLLASSPDRGKRVEGLAHEIIPLGIKTSLFPAQTQAGGPPWRLIRVGTLNAVKDSPTLLRALASLPENVTLDIVGEDTIGGATQTLAREMGVERRITFHGWQPTERVSELYRTAHVNVVSSRHEAANIAMLEAACSGVPTVGTAVGYVADFDPDRAVGVPIQDPRALAAAISALLRDPARRTRIAEAARRWVLAHDADWTARAFEALYSRVKRG